jgi:hypothetical protein
VTRRLILLLAALAGTGGAGCGAFAPRLPDDPVARHEAIAAIAWGPESPEALQKFLDSKQALKATYDNYEDGIQNWSLREAATGRAFGPTLIGVASMRKRLDGEAAKRGLTVDDLQRMTILVYGRWLRASRPGPVPEEGVVRTLKEMEVGLTRQLAKAAASGDVSIDTAAIQARIDSIRHQVKFLEPYATMDKKATLEAIDPATRGWLEAHRKEVEALDWLYFDTAPPPRSEPKKKA